MRLLVKWLLLFIACLVGLGIILVSLRYYSPDFQKGFLIGKESYFAFYQYPLYAHIIAAPVALFTGVFQFGRTRSRLHKLFGRVYVFAILVIAAPSGLMMSFWALGGLPSIINFLLLSILWWCFTYQALMAIKKGDVAQHKTWMTRSFILTNSAIAIRLLSFVNNNFEIIDITTGYILIGWLSWLPWWLIYELRLKRNQNTIMST